MPHLAADFPRRRSPTRRPTPFLGSPVDALLHGHPGGHGPAAGRAELPRARHPGTSPRFPSASAMARCTTETPHTVGDEKFVSPADRSASCWHESGIP
jgi:hypothetical protein